MLLKSAFGSAPVASAPWGECRPVGPTWDRDRLALGAAAALLITAHLAALALVQADAYRPGIAAMLASGLPYGIAAWLVLARRARLSLPAIIAVGVALRLVLLPFDPSHSTDIYRYIWDGRVQAAGISPYLHVPADPALTGLRDETIWARINRADYATTIYPPGAQAFFFVVTRLGESVTTMKLALVACEGITVWALLRLLVLEGLPRERLLIYAWCPLPAWEIAGGGHVDALMIATAMLAVLAARLDRGGWAGAALGFGVVVKIFPLILAPTLWRRFDLRFPFAAAAIVGAGYLAYGWAAGARVIGFAPTYASEEGIRDGSGFWLLRLTRLAAGYDIPPGPYLAVAAATLLALGASAAFGGGPARPPRLGHALALAFAATMVLSSQYPWYFAWLLPLACLVPAGNLLVPPTLWLTGSGFLLYWDWSRGVPWIADVVYGGAVLLLLASVARRYLPALKAYLVRRIEE